MDVNPFLNGTDPDCGRKGMMPYSSVDRYQTSEGIYYLYVFCQRPSDYL